MAETKDGVEGWESSSSALLLQKEAEAGANSNVIENLSETTIFCLECNYHINSNYYSQIMIPGFFNHAYNIFT